MWSPRKSGSALRRGQSAGFAREDPSGGSETGGLGDGLPVSTAPGSPTASEAAEDGPPGAGNPTGYLAMAVGSASLNSVVLGYDIGVFGPAISIIRDEMGLTTAQVSTAAGLSAFTAILGAVGAGIVSDRYGRTRTLTLAAMLFMTGAMIMASARKFGGLLMGRLITGFGVGTGLAIDPLYISEISPPMYRGALVSASEVCINVGIIMGSATSLLLTSLAQDPNVAWRFMLGLGAVVPISIITISCTILPETPRWLIEKQRQPEALRVMRRLCSDEDEVKLTMADLQRALQRAKEAGEVTWGDMLLRPTPGSRLMLTVVIGVALFQQLSGVEVITVYTPIILKDQAHLSDSASSGIFFGLVVWKTAMVILAAALLDRIAGRRRLLLISCAGMCLAQSVIAAGFASDSPAASVAGLASYVTMFSIGIGPVTWLLASEVLPTSMRAKGMVLACSANRFIAGVSLLAFLGVQGDGSTPGTGWHGFAIFALVAFVAGLFVYFLVPETKCKTLEEMGEFFDNAARSRAWLLDRLFCCWPARDTLPGAGVPTETANGRDRRDPRAGNVDASHIELISADGNANMDAQWNNDDGGSAGGGNLEPLR